MKHARLLPDVARLLWRLGRDRTLPRHVRWRVWLLAAYLVSPLDLIPDFIPVIGVLDEIIVIGWTLRSIVKRAGRETVAAHWPGTDEGLVALYSLARIKDPVPA